MAVVRQLCSEKLQDNSIFIEDAVVFEGTSHNWDMLVERIPGYFRTTGNGKSPEGYRQYCHFTFKKIKDELNSQRTQALREFLKDVFDFLK